MTVALNWLAAGCAQSSHLVHSASLQAALKQVTKAELQLSLLVACEALWVTIPGWDAVLLLLYQGSVQAIGVC